MDTAWVALLGTIFAGAGFKVIEFILSKNQRKVDTATALREELRKESQALREEMRTVEKALDEWKDKYYTLLQNYLDLKSTLEKPGKDEEGESW